MSRKFSFLFIALLCYIASGAQKLESIHINLYTDSLKKGFYNYINVDGKMSDGTWQPLDSNTILFTANTGFFKGNDLFIDSSYTGETVTVKAALRKDPKITKEVTIWIRKRGFTEPLKTSEEIMEEIKTKTKVKKKG
jgi:hypothetical protein